MRTVKNLFGRMVGSLLGMVAKGPLDKALGHTIEAIKTRGAGRLDA